MNTNTKDIGKLIDRDNGKKSLEKLYDNVKRTGVKEHESTSNEKTDKKK